MNIDVFKTYFNFLSCPTGLPPVALSAQCRLQIYLSSFSGLITYLFPTIVSISAIVFFIMIIGGGFGILASAGADADPKKAAQAKATLTSGLVGFLLIVSSYFILQIVGYVTGVNFLKPVI